MLPTKDHLAEAAALFLRRGDISVSHLQRHFRLAYSSGCELMSLLEQAGVVGMHEMVVPHLSGGMNGLNSDDSVQLVGKMARELLAA